MTNAATKDPWGNTRVGVSATTKVNRKDFGLTWNTALETGGVLIGDEVIITLDVEFVRGIKSSAKQKEANHVIAAA